MKESPMKTFVIAAAMTLVATVANAQNFFVSYAPGGGGMATATLVNDFLKTNGYITDFKSLGNCALVKNEWDNTKDKFITLYEEGFLSNKNTPCNIDFKPTEYLHMTVQGNYYFCSVPGKEADLWRKPGATYTVAHVPSFPVDAAFESINAKNKNTAKPVSYKNLGAVATAITAKEVDYVLVTGGTDKIVAEGGKCFWTTAPKSMALNNVPNVSEEFPGNKAGNASVNTFLLAKNFTAVEIEKLRKDIDAFLRGEEWTKYLKGRDLPNTINLTVPEQLKMIKGNIEILNNSK